MRGMKDSGVEWIGEMPVDWRTAEIKYYCESVYAGGTPQSNNPDYWNGDIPWLPSGVCHDSKIYEAPKHITQLGFENSSTKKIPSNTALVAMTGATCGNTGYLTFDACANQSVVAYVVNAKAYSLFIWYLLQAAKDGLLTYQTGGAQGGVNVEDCKNIVVPYIEFEEQRKIANHLDKQCSKIDEIIEKQQMIIEKLKEYKLSIITEVVTKGLNNGVKMRDSGTKWLGHYPNHWDYLAFKNVLRERNEKNNPVQIKERLSLSIEKGVTLYAEKTTNLDRFKDDYSQYKLAYEGDLVMNSMNMIVGAVGVSDYFGCVSPAYYTFFDSEKDHCTAKYCEYLMKCKTMKKVLHSLGKGIMSIDRGDDRINTCRLKVSRTDLKSLKIPVPPIKEQREIVDYLQKKEKLINQTIKQKESLIEKIQEYKASLIYELITGKVKI